MSSFKCPYCGKGEMVPEVISNYATKMGGVPVEISDAQISRCTNCGETSVGAKELKRWEQLQQQQLRCAGQIPSPEEVTRIRTTLGLSVSDFAKLFGVTRQTIHAWERPESAALQLGPAALLLALLAEQMAGRVNGVFECLLEKTAARGQEIQAPDTPGSQDNRSQTRSCISPRPAGGCFFSKGRTAA